MRGAIFDLDGTLADTAADLLSAANAVLVPEGLPALDPAIDKAVAGRGGRSMIRASLTRAGHDPDTAAALAQTDALYPKLLVAYERGIDTETRLYDGVLACLDALEGTGWRLGVCTNKPERLALILLERLGVLERFAAVLGADTLAVCKPDPEHFRETARRSGALPERSVLVGDTRTDRDTARAAGVPVVLTSFGFALERLSDLAPDAVVSHYEEVPGVLERLCPA